MDCLLCGLEQPSESALSDHTTRVHQLSTDAVDKLLASGRRDLGDHIADRWRAERGVRLPDLGARATRTEDPTEPDPAPRRSRRADGGYL